MPHLRKFCSLAILASIFALSAEAHKSYQTPPLISGETSETADGQTIINTQIGSTIYACVTDPTEPRTIIADSIYNAQKHRFNLDRLSWRERKQAGLPKRLHERYVDTLPMNVGVHSLILKHSIVSEHTEGNGLCLGISSRSNYGGQHRTKCGFGVGAKISFNYKTQSHRWCVLGQDALTQLEDKPAPGLEVQES